MMVPADDRQHIRLEEPVSLSSSRFADRTVMLIAKTKKGIATLVLRPDVARQVRNALTRELRR